MAAKSFNLSHLSTTMLQSLERKRIFRSLIIGIVVLASVGLVGCHGSINEPAPKLVQDNTIELISPRVKLYASVSSLSSNGLNLNIDVMFVNPNSLAIDISNIELIVGAETGRNYIHNTIPGGAIYPLSDRAFVQSFIIPTDVLSNKKVIVMVDAQAKVAETTFPLSTTTTINIADLRYLIDPPQIVLHASIEQVDVSGLNTKLETQLTNPNPLRLDIGIMEILVKGQQGNNLYNGLMSGGSIESKSDGVFNSDIVLPYEALNEQRLEFSINAMVGLASFTFPLRGTTTFQVPGLDTLISIPELTMDVQYKWILTTTPFPSVELQYSASMKNSNRVALTIKERRLDLYKSDGTLLRLATLGSTSFPAFNDLTWSYTVTFGEDISGLFGSEVTVKLEADIGLESVDATIPISASKIIKRL